MAAVLAKFDGRVFVPCEAVELPAGTVVEVIVPTPPRPFTPEEAAEWEETLRLIRTSDGPFPTLDDAMQFLRKRG